MSNTCKRRAKEMPKPRENLMSLHVGGRIKPSRKNPESFFIALFTSRVWSSTERKTKKFSTANKEFFLKETKELGRRRKVSRARRLQNWVVVANGADFNNWYFNFVPFSLTTFAVSISAPSFLPFFLDKEFHIPPRLLLTSNISLCERFCLQSSFREIVFLISSLQRRLHLFHPWRLKLSGISI